MLVERLLLEAAEAAGLSDAFVRIMALGDFSVSYKVSGFLEEVSTLISVRSRLNAQVLDGLHAGGIEIVSPNFMNQRVLADGSRFAFDPAQRAPAAAPEAHAAPEAIVFDKAESAAGREELQQRHDALVAERAELADAAKHAPEAEQQRHAQRVVALDREIEALAAALAVEPPEAD